MEDMIVLAGASASGKTEVAKLLASKYGITKVITTTTRAIRCNEVNGRDYFFVSKEKFHEMLKQDLFVEYTTYNENLYGSTKDQIAHNTCIVIDPIGLKSYIDLNNKNIITFFLDSNEETRFKRMLDRGDKLENALARIANDKEAFKKENIPEVDYHIDSEHYSIEEVCDMIYKIYIKHLETLEK